MMIHTTVPLSSAMHNVVSNRVALKMVIFKKSIYLTVSPLKCVPFDVKTLCGKFKQYILKFRGSSMTLKNQ